ncbi:hypothetical protein HYZ82_00905 [Candidatus Nomurabacteria bacterium]|nr:hypothetical protein [Candidatus Nomurabacteria bacterium]
MEKIKQFIESDKGKDVLTVLVVILVGLGAFLLGRLSKENDTSGIKIEYQGTQSDLDANAISSLISVKEISTSQNSVDKNFFASNRGTKYYSIGCSGGKTIKQENRVYFDTREEAEKAGYELSSSCR